MKLNKIQLERVGPFGKLAMEFPSCFPEDGAEVHIFTGPNGCGKSTLLYALAAELGDKKLIRDRCWDGDSRFEITFNPPLPKAPLLPNEPNPPQQGYWTHGTPDDLRWSQAAFAYSGQRQLTSSPITAMKELDRPPLEGSLAFRNVPDSSQIFQWIANQRTKEALLRINHKNEMADRHARAITRLNKAISQIVDVDFRFIVEAEPLGVVVEVDGRKLGIDVLPDGLKSVISWVADLLMRLERVPWVNNDDLFQRRIILFLDEIDIHLHPKWQQKILPAVRRLFPNAQIFVSTHSPFVVNSVANAWVYGFGLENGVSVLTSKNLTKTSSSLDLVLASVFEVEETFGMETEKALDGFYNMKLKVMADDSLRSDFLVLARNLAGESLEIKDIVGRELLQLSRTTGREFSLS